MTDHPGKLIQLFPHPPKGDADDGVSFLACKPCRNKTYVLQYDRSSEYPLMKCACCGQAMGRMGWYYDEPQANKQPVTLSDGSIFIDTSDEPAS